MDAEMGAFAAVWGASVGAKDVFASAVFFAVEVCEAIRASNWGVSTVRCVNCIFFGSFIMQVLPSE